MRERNDHALADEAALDEAYGWLARLRGPSTAADHAAFEDWYSADPRHAEAYDSLLDNWDVTARSRLTDTGLSRSRGATAGGRRYAVAAAIAATIAIALFAFGAYGAVSRNAGTNGNPQLASRTGEIRVLSLVDGSSVTLDAGSAIRPAYSQAERRIELVQGRARFSVAAGEDRPFVVETPAGAVVAHGTVFDVAVEEARAIVSLIEGSIEVRPRGGGREAPVMLAAGQRTVIEAGKPASRPARLDDREIGWPDAMLSFENAPLGEVVAAANRTGATRIVLADPSLGQLRFTGTIRAAETAALAEMVAAMFDLRVSRERDALVLSQLRASRTGEKIPG